MDRIKVQSPATTSGHPPLRMACPHCRRHATVEGLQKDLRLEAGVSPRIAGFRRCTNSECLGLVFVVYRDPEEVLLSFPPERLDFDPEGIPERVTSAFEEAIACHATQCYMASAMMVRKTLEEICTDQDVDGENLKARLKALRSTVVLPDALLDAMGDLRLLGNDAAHSDIRTFEGVGKEEVEVAIDVTKEILKGVYQYESLLDRIQELKQTDEGHD